MQLNMFKEIWPLRLVPQRGEHDLYVKITGYAQVVAQRCPMPTSPPTVHQRARADAASTGADAVGNKILSCPVRLRSLSEIVPPCGLQLHCRNEIVPAGSSRFHCRREVVPAGGSRFHLRHEIGPLRGSQLHFRNDVEAPGGSQCHFRNEIVSPWAHNFIAGTSEIHK